MMLRGILRMYWTQQLKKAIPINDVGGENSCCMFTIQVSGNLTSLKVELQIDISKLLSVWNSVFEVKLQLFSLKCV